VADHGGTGHLPDDEQPAAGLRVGEQQQLVLADRAVEVRADPVEVAPGARR